MSTANCTSTPCTQYGHAGVRGAGTQSGGPHCAHSAGTRGVRRGRMDAHGACVPLPRLFLALPIPVRSFRARKLFLALEPLWVDSSSSVALVRGHGVEAALQFSLRAPPPGCCAAPYSSRSSSPASTTASQTPLVSHTDTRTSHARTDTHTHADTHARTRTLSGTLCSIRRVRYTHGHVRATQQVHAMRVPRASGYNTGRLACRAGRMLGVLSHCSTLHCHPRALAGVLDERRCASASIRPRTSCACAYAAVLVNFSFGKKCFVAGSLRPLPTLLSALRLT